MQLPLVAVHLPPRMIPLNRMCALEKVQPGEHGEVKPLLAVVIASRLVPSVKFSTK
jgi:hypothetical protein